MALGDYDFVQQAGDTFTQSLNLSNPINGTGSLAIGFPPANATTEFTQIHLNSSFDPDRGITQGRLECIFRFDWDVAPQFTFDNCGMFMTFMCTNADPIANNAEFYAVGFIRARNAAGATPCKFVVLKTPDLVTNWTNASFGNGGTEIFLETEPLIALTEGLTMPMRVDWQLDLVNLGGLRVTASHGDIGDTDYSNLAVKYDFIDGGVWATPVVREGFSFIYNDTHAMQPTEGTILDDWAFYNLV